MIAFESDPLIELFLNLTFGALEAEKKMGRSQISWSWFLVVIAI